MHRSFAWVMIAILAIMLAPFAGVPGVPASAVHADTAAPTVPPPPDDEIIVITSTGQLRVDDPTVPTGYKSAAWSSSSVPGWESDWTAVAAGDFNGDGDAELVAARSTTTGNPAGSYIKVFDPVVQPGSTLVDFNANLSLDAPVGVMRNVRLLVTGDFDKDGRDEFAFVNYLPGGGSAQAAVQVYDNDATSGWVRRTYDAGYGVMFEDMGVGDFNADGRDDLVLVRNGDRQVRVMNVSPWTLMASENGINATDWYAVAGGNISNTPSTPGDEITALRDSSNAQTNNLVTFRVSGALSVWPNPLPDWKYNPSFASISNGNLNDGPTKTDPDDEIVLLRDAGSASGTSLLVLNPFGDTMPDFRQATGNGANLFKIVRTGDTDGDGLDEIVILRGNLYRVYTEPNVDARNTETAGAFYTSGGVSNLPFLAVANVDGPGIAEGPVLSVTPPSLSFSLNCGDTSEQDLTISNSGTGSSIAWQAQAIEDQTVGGGPWLLLSKTSGTTQDTVKVSVRPGIAKGNYTGKVRVTTTDQTVNVPVSYAALCSGFSASPGTLNFNVPWGSTGTQSLAIGGPGPTAWSSTVSPVPPTSSCSWLTLSATTGTTPVNVNVSANAATAGVGFKQCSIMFAADAAGVPGSPQHVTVNLTVADPGFVVTPTDITIRQKSDFSTVVTRQVKIERPKVPTTWRATALSLDAAASLKEKLATGQADFSADGLIIDGVLVPPPAWLVFTPDTGTTPTTVTMTVNVSPATPPGTYHAVIFIVATDPSLPDQVQEVYVTAIVAKQFTFLPLITK